MGTRIYVVKLPLLKKGKKEIQHLLSTCSCAMSFSPFSLLTRLPGMPFVLQSFGSSTTCRSQETDGMANFRGQIIQ